MPKEGILGNGRQLLFCHPLPLLPPPPPLLLLRSNGAAQSIKINASFCGQPIEGRNSRFNGFSLKNGRGRGVSPPILFPFLPSGSSRGTTRHTRETLQFIFSGLVIFFSSDRGHKARKSRAGDGQFENWFLIVHLRTFMNRWCHIKKTRNLLLGNGIANIFIIVVCVKTLCPFVIRK